MSKKSVEDYLTEGIHGPRRPKESERRKYLGTLRERIVLALTIGQVMTDSGVEALEKAMKEHPDTKLLINGQVSHRFLQREKEVANRCNIPYTVISNENVETDIGAVLTYDHAVHIENIFIEEQNDKNNFEENNDDSPSLFKKVKKWFKR